jgi:hypothetical protein
VIQTLVNVVLLNVGWFSCVLGAAAGLPWIGPVVVAGVVAVHVATVREKHRTFTLLAAAAAFGYVVDSALVLGGAMSFGDAARLGGPSPLWMVALWVNLATAMHVSLGWLCGRPVVAMLIGGIGGPLAYIAGARLGAITFGSGRVVSLAAIAVAWMFAMPVMALLGRATAAKVAS